MKFTIITLLLLFVIAAFVAPVPAKACCISLRNRQTLCVFIDYNHTLVGDCFGSTYTYVQPGGFGSNQISPQINLCPTYHYTPCTQGDGCPCVAQFTPAKSIACTIGTVAPTVAHAQLLDQLAYEARERENATFFFKELWQQGQTSEAPEANHVDLKKVALKVRCIGGGYVPDWVKG